MEEKRAAAQGECFVDWAPWGGAVADNQQHILPLARAGVLGFKCFLIYPGCDGFTMIDQQQLEAALPFIAESGLPLLVHAELAGPIDAATERLRNADWRSYATYLASRPDQAELEAIRLMIRLCRQYRFRLHIVHLSTALALEELQRRPCRRPADHSRNLSALSALCRRRDRRRRNPVEVRSADSQQGKSASNYGVDCAME